MVTPLSREEHQQVMALWRKHGGATHGPRVETITMPEENFRAFVDELLLCRERQYDWEHVAEEMGTGYAVKHRGERPQLYKET